MPSLFEAMAMGWVDLHHLRRPGRDLLSRDSVKSCRYAVKLEKADEHAGLFCKVIERSVIDSLRFWFSGKLCHTGFKRVYFRIICMMIICTRTW